MTLFPIDAARVSGLGGGLAAAVLPAERDFVFSRSTPYFPPRGAAWAAPFFVMAVKQLFGPAVSGGVDGRFFSSEDFLWMALSRTVQEDPGFLLPARQAAMDEASMSRALRDDAGACPTPLVRTHAELARAFGRALLEGGWTVNKLLESARRDDRPARRFVSLVGELPGYREDPLKRKAFYLTYILTRRPEGFLPPDPEWPPLAGRDALRVVRRWGVLGEPDTLPPSSEADFRLGAYEVLARVHQSAGKSAAETEHLFSTAGTWCPEDRPPDCGACVFSASCARRTERLSPPFVTTAY